MSRHEASPPIAQTLDRGLRILEAVSQAGGALTVAEAACAAGLDRTVAHRLVVTLATRGYLQRESGGGYRLGPTCLALASVVTDLRAAAKPHLDALRDATGETVHLVILSGREVVFVDGTESIHALRVAARTGRHLPAHATSVGKALLAALPPGRFAALYGHGDLVAVTQRTICDPQALERDLALTRERGYATSRGESENGVGSVGVAVRNPAGDPQAALSVAMPLDRFTEQVERQTATLLRSAAAELGARL